MFERRPRFGASLLALLASAPIAGAQESNEFDCLIAPRQVVDLASGEPGVLEEVLVDRGDRVQKGQLVARLDTAVQEATVELARARVEADAAQKAAGVRHSLAARNHDRSSNLRQREQLSTREFEESETQLELATLQMSELEENRRLARLELRRAEAQLERRRLRSPVDGVIVHRYRSPGEYVEEDPVFQIVAVDSLHVEVVLPDAMVGAIGSGQQAEVRVSGAAAQTREATVVVIDPVLDGATSTFGVRLELPNADGAVHAGSRCRVRFLGRTAEAGPPPATSATTPSDTTSAAMPPGPSAGTGAGKL